MTRQSKSPAGLLLPEHPVPVLLLRANDLRFGAKEMMAITKCLIPVPTVSWVTVAVRALGQYARTSDG